MYLSEACVFTINELLSSFLVSFSDSSYMLDTISPDTISVAFIASKFVNLVHMPSFYDNPSSKYY